jgi:hypothetical protein
MTSDVNNFTESLGILRDDIGHDNFAREAMARPL